MTKEIIHKTLVALIVMFGLPQFVSGQLLFSEECFTGGVMAVGINEDLGSDINTISIHWDDDYIFKNAYVVTYRYGRPAPHSMYLNALEVPWNFQNQVSPELPEENSWSNWFAVHVQELDSIPNLEIGFLTLDFPPQQFYDFAWNWGWWSMYVVVLYEAPDIDTMVCNRIYIADHRQDNPQSYTFVKPNFLNDTPVLFSVFASRLTEFFFDRARLTLNNEILGEIWGHEQFYKYGTQGHFYYENSTPVGLGNDTANTTLNQYDGIAVINNYLMTSQPEQSLSIARVIPHPTGGANPNPAFVITYTPSCTVPESAVERKV